MVIEINTKSSDFYYQLLLILLKVDKEVLFEKKLAIYLQISLQPDIIDL